MIALLILFLVIGILHLAQGLVEYVVYPADEKDVSACSQINDALVKMFGDSGVQIYKSQIRQTTEFWLIQAYEVRKEIILKIPGVRVLSHVQHDCNDSS